MYLRSSVSLLAHSCSRKALQHRVSILQNSFFKTIKTTSEASNTIGSMAVVKEMPMLKQNLQRNVAYPSENWQDVSPFAFGNATSSGCPALDVGLKLEAEDEVILNNLNVQPVDRGPSDAVVVKSWQYQLTESIAAARALMDLEVVRIPSGGPEGMKHLASELISRYALEDNFYMVDLGNVQRLFKAWKSAMPRVQPFYAVKCYPEPAILKLLAAIGTGFDCASKGELEAVLKLGVPQQNVIFAHPCKRPSDIRFAQSRGVRRTTFDTLSELHKIAAMCPDDFDLVLRIRADDPDARVPLGLKYGAEVEEAPALLNEAKRLGLNVVGVSFHVGSACKNLATFTTAIERTRLIFDAGTALGYEMKFIDIGGGFTGRFDEHGDVMFGEIASTINSALDQYFPVEMGVRIIAEPGRYFAETSSTLMTPVYGLRDRIDPSGSLRKDYWITDGLYGSFNCIIYDGQNPEYQIVRSPLLPAVTAAEEAVKFNSTLWGPTCDSADCIYKDVGMPQLRNGDWLMWNNAGAYTVAGACDFNGIEFTTPSKFYVFSDCAVELPEGPANAAVVGEAVLAASGSVADVL